MILWAPWGSRERSRPSRSVEARSAATRFAVREHRAMSDRLWAATMAAEFYALRPVVFEPDAPIVGLDVVFSLVGGSFAAFGLVAWHRRPDSRSGMLMTATGFAFFVSPLLARSTGRSRTPLDDLLVDSLDLLLRRAAADAADQRAPAARPRPGCVGAYAVPLVFLQLAWMLFLERGRQPAAGVPGRAGRPRARRAPNAGCSSAPACHRRRDRRPLAGRLGAATPGAAAERRRRAVPAPLRGAAGQRPRCRDALGAAARGSPPARW